MTDRQVGANLDLRFNDIKRFGAFGIEMSARNTLPLAAAGDPPSNKDAYWHPDTREWFGYDSVEDRWVGAELQWAHWGFGNQSPYAANAFARYDNTITNINHDGMTFHDPVVVDRIVAHSTRQLGAVPSALCKIELYRNGTLDVTLTWDGVNYTLDKVYNREMAAGDTLNFQYLNDPIGQSAGKVVAYFTYRKFIS